MEKSQLGIRQYGWFDLLCDSLDEHDRKELDALLVRVIERQAAIAVARHQ